VKHLETHSLDECSTTKEKMEMYTTEPFHELLYSGDVRLVDDAAERARSLVDLEVASLCTAIF
jgi:hypothetical protein